MNTNYIITVVQVMFNTSQLYGYYKYILLTKSIGYLTVTYCTIMNNISMCIIKSHTLYVLIANLLFLVAGSLLSN